MTPDERTDMHTADAGGAPVDRPVGRPVDEATDAEGPRGTYGCACPSRDGRICITLRYGEEAAEDLNDRCQCLCHEWDDDDELG